jgi:hypothetical protein
VRRDAVGGYKAGGNVWRGSNLPNNVAAGPEVVVQESQACFGDEIGETHICRCVVASMEWENRRCCVEREGPLQFLMEEIALGKTR